jgi:hypothetical protein
MTEKQKADRNIKEVIKAARSLIVGLVDAGDIGIHRHTAPEPLIRRLALCLSKVPDK